MVGAGFSRFALRPSEQTPEPPLWSEFRNAMAEKLYPGGGAPSDPLRLAEEYRAGLGQHALEELITALVTDERWEPGDEHKQLLDLPWTDVLTTNWDTLLERTQVSNPSQCYSVVRTLQDISKCRAPRIVKLHGTLPSNRPFIFAEEDYRTYPARFAPFVNLAQQVLLENELCLVGFSGDDPNFLQWIGWVRDHLKDHARPIRLVGVLRLSSGRREMLKNYNITPIDLTPLVSSLHASEQHSEANRLFLKFLSSRQPKPLHVWERLQRRSSSEDKGKNADDKAAHYTDIWKKDRTNYPGWLVAPLDSQQEIRIDVQEDFVWRDFNFREIKDEKLKCRYFYEISWLKKRALLPFDAEFDEQLRTSWQAVGQKELNVAEQIDLLVLALSEARLRFDDEAFQYWKREIETHHPTKCEAELQYNLALYAKANLAFEQALEYVDKIKSTAPLWLLRKAMVLSRTSRESEAKALIQRAFAEIRSQRVKDPRSIHLLSLEAWAAYLLRGLRWDEADSFDWPKEYATKDCDPYDLLRDVERRLYKDKLKDSNAAKEKTPNFDPGHATYHSGKGWVNPSWRENSLNIFFRVSEVSGIPTSLNSTSFLTSNFSDFIQLTTEFSSNLKRHFLFWGISAKDEALDKVFNRIEVANTDISVVRELIAKLRIGIDHEINTLRRGTAGGRHERHEYTLKFFLEVYSRLVIRLTSDEAKSTFEWAVSILRYEDIQRKWQFGSALGHLLKRSYSAVAKSERTDFAKLLIAEPIAKSPILGRAQDWPELSHYIGTSALKGITKLDGFEDAFSQWLKLASGDDGEARNRALYRLMSVESTDELTAQQIEQLDAAMWSKIDEKQNWPKDHNFFRFAIVNLKPSDGLRCEKFRETVVLPIIEGHLSDELIQDVSGALQRKFECVSESERLQIAQVLIEWVRPVYESTEASQLFGNDNLQLGQLITRTLAHSILPFFEPGQLTTDLKQLWRSALLEGWNPSLIATAYQYFRLVDADDQDIQVTLRKALLSRDDDRKGAACFAAGRILNDDQFKSSPLRDTIASEVLAACEVGGNDSASQVLWAAREGVLNDCYSLAECEALSNSMQVMESFYSYSRWNPEREDTHEMTLVRVALVRLAKAILDKGMATEFVENFVNSIQDDAMPEVRFALSSIELEDD